MNFSVQEINENDLHLVRLTDLRSGTGVDILPSLGATLHAFRVQNGQSLQNIIDNYPDGQSAKNEMARSFKGPKLSPFVCRIPNGQYQWNGRQYEFATRFVDGSAIHGLLYNRSFAVVEMKGGEQQSSVQLEYRYASEDAGYPFDYSCKVIYTLQPGNQLEVVTIVTNLSQDTIPVADGWHPYFTLGASINECDLQFESETMLEFDEKLVPTGKFINKPGFKKGIRINDLFLDNCFQVDQATGGRVCSLYDAGTKVRLNFYADSSYPYLQIFTPDHRKSIAIENLSGAPDCFNNGMGVKKIAPGGSESFTVRYEVKIG